MLVHLTELVAISDPSGWGPALLHHPLLKWWAPLLLVPLLWLGAERPLRRRLELAYRALVAVAVVGFGGLCLARTVANIRQPPEWDMLAFWLFGAAARQGNFYDPSHLHAVAATLPSAGIVLTDPLFVQDVLDVGFPYPPPTMLLFAGLGYLDPHSA
ncbi:MAG TPA: hypothetical protein VEB21_18305, partial [Terriglobales bacterium]|nr:hypothetical protein [Terriglobales bacterium]